ncbi:MAG: HAD family phosphatase [Planctomycetes bacterium]|nr:HAD family phosphatase [Planctomycetota bacterium]
MNPPVKLLALDLDGTLLDPGGIILDEVRAALGVAAQRGIAVVIATGRPLKDTLGFLAKSRFALADGFPHALIIEGREIFLLGKSGYEPMREWNEASVGRCQAVLPMAQGLLAEACAWCAGRGLGHKRVPPEVETARKVAVAFFETVAGAEAALGWLRGEIAQRGAPLQAGRNVHVIGVGPDALGKGITLRRLIERLGVEPSSVLAIGDTQNDEDMLDGGYGYQCGTTANAEEAIKALVRGRGGPIASLPYGRGVLEILKATGCSA